MFTAFLLNLASWTRPLRYWFVRMTYRGSDEARAIGEWRNRFAGMPMLVVGNGPSLNHTPLSEFAHVPSIGMNKIDLLFPRTTWRPCVIMCTNDMVSKQHWAEWQKLDIPVLLSWKGRWFIPRAVRRHFHYFLTLLARDFSDTPEQGFGAGYTVTYAALQFAYMCGANPVVMFGVDHSFVQKDKPSTYERREGPDVNHFDPNYFAAGTLWGIANLKESEHDYERARIAFEKDGRRVLDATIGGKLTIFPKISLDEAREILKN